MDRKELMRLLKDDDEVKELVRQAGRETLDERARAEAIARVRRELYHLEQAESLAAEAEHNHLRDVLEQAINSYRQAPDEPAP